MAVAEASAADGVRIEEELTDDELALACILLDKSGVDLAEFLFVDETKADGCFRLFPFQWPWWRAAHDRDVDQGARDVGKALDVDTLIPTPHGWSTMGHLKVGDVVYAEDGKPCSVVDAFEVMHGRPCFEVEFDDHSSIVADADHEWLTWSRLDFRAHQRGRRGHSAQLRTTAELAASELMTVPGKNGYFEYNFRIPVAGPLECGDRADLLIPPYTLGAWLGDGSSYRAHMTIGSEDRDEMIRLLEADGFTVEKLTSEFAYALKNPAAQNHQRGTVTNLLSRLSVRANKHIPVRYMRASAESRLALLQGLMDTDGHITLRHGRCEITLKSEVLARQTAELLVSLGQKPFFEKRTAYCNGVDAGPVYRVGFAPNGIVPFRLSRKAARVRPGQPSNTGFRRIVAVRPVPSRPVRCIAVDSPSHLFLAGEAMVPTHNSERICAKSCAFPHSYPGNEHVLSAPEGSHLDKLTNRIEHRITSSRLLESLVQGGRGGITHRPFHIKWRNGAQTYTVLPQKSGLGMKGVHAIWLDVDEAQDWPERAWQEANATVRWDVAGASWTAHGVSKGVRDKFWEITEEGSGWHVHRVFKMHKPTYDKVVDRAKDIKDYGSIDSPDYIRNIWGEHGTSANRIFVLLQLMACVDTRPDGSDVNDSYYQPTIVGEEIARLAGSKAAVEMSSQDATDALIGMLEFPAEHRQKGWSFICGMDVGLVGDPSELVVLAEYAPSKKERAEHLRNEIAVPDEGVTRLRLVTRIRMLRVPEPLQADLIMHLIDFYKPRAFALDAGGNGLPLFQELQKRAGKSRTMIVAPPEDADAAALAAFEEQRSRAEQAWTVIKGYKFGSKLVVDFDESKVAELTNPSMSEMVEKAGIMQECKTRSTDVLRTLVDNRRLLLPNDGEVTNQMNGQTFVHSAEPVDAYGKRRAVYSVGQFHILDAFRFAGLAHSQERIESMIKEPPKKRAPVLDRFIGG